MSNTAARVLLLGGTGRFPFNGYFVFRVECGTTRAPVGLVGAGCLCTTAEPPDAFETSRLVLRQARKATGRTRFEVMRSAWELLRALDPAELGPERGADLALLMLASDADGQGIAATGLTALYTRRNDAFSPLVPPVHPLLGMRGLLPPPSSGEPEALPGVLTPDSPVSLLVGAPATGARPLPSDAGWRLACGDRDE